jgi:hypothetical protein
MIIVWNAIGIRKYDRSQKRGEPGTPTPALEKEEKKRFRPSRYMIGDSYNLYNHKKPTIVLRNPYDMLKINSGRLG